MSQLQTVPTGWQHKVFQSEEAKQAAVRIIQQWRANLASGSVNNGHMLPDQQRPFEAVVAMCPQDINPLAVHAALVRLFDQTSLAESWRISTKDNFGVYPGGIGVYRLDNPSNVTTQLSLYLPPSKNHVFLDRTLREMKAKAEFQIVEQIQQNSIRL